MARFPAAGSSPPSRRPTMIAGAMERRRRLKLVFTEDEVYELLLRCVTSDEEDNPAFRSALEKLASAIKRDRRAA